MNDKLKDLQDEKYWDLGIKGKYRVLQLRQEWDRETCIELRDEIISAIKLKYRVKGWAEDEGWSYSETCKELLDEL